MPTVINSDQQPPAKRSKTTTACQSCRERKLSCGGSRPCNRCRQEGRECTDPVAADRTPLTRKRMTDLEESLVELDHLWTALFPQSPLDLVRGWLSSVGLDATVQKIRDIGGLSSSQSFAGPTSVPAQLPSDTRASEPTLTPLSSRTATNQHDVVITHPSTRSVSPQTESIRIPLNLHNVSHGASHAWNEEDTPRNRLSGTSEAERDTAGTTPGNDFGTGVHAGAGYIGLSSAATLLRAIQKFAPEELLPPNYRLGRGIGASVLLTSANLNRLTRLPTLQDGDGFDAPVLPPYSEIGPLVDSYFKYFHALTPIVHEPTIRAQITGAFPLPTGCGSRVLLNMIFATGEFDAVLNDDHGTNGEKYYEEARAALQQDLLEGGSLMLVQGLAIMAIWLQRSNKPNAGYICLGLAIRMACALGAHAIASNNVDNGLTVLEVELRNRIWWCLVTLEGGQCMTYGRPHGISLPLLSAVRLPVNTDDENLTVSTTQLPSDAQRVTLYTALIMQARLAQIALHSLDRISRSLPCPTAEQIARYGNQFRDQLAALPAYMQSHMVGPYRLARKIQVWRGRDYRSILYRPVLLSAAWDTNGSAASDATVQEIINICRNLAMENLQDITEFVRTDPDPHRGCEWYTLYFGIQASLTILLSIVWEPQHASAASWRVAIQETVMWLRQLGSMKELGLSYAQLMENVLAVKSGVRNGLAIATTGVAIPAEQHAEQPMTDLERFDFERYLSEIWEGQMQFASLTGDVGLGMASDVWDDMVGGM